MPTRNNSIRQTKKAVPQTLYIMQLPAQTDISDGFQKCGIDAFRVIDDELDRVRAHIAEHLVPMCSDELVRRLVERLNGWSGKMIRPGLMLLAGRTTGEITD